MVTRNVNNDYDMPLETWKTSVSWLFGLTRQGLTHTLSYPEENARG